MKVKIKKIKKLYVTIKSMFIITIYIHTKRLVFGTYY